MSAVPPDTVLPDDVDPGSPQPLQIQMDPVPQPIVRDLGGFIFYGVGYSLAILSWSVVWVSLMFMLGKMGVTQLPSVWIRVIWSIPLLGMLAGFISGGTTTGWIIYIYITIYLMLWIAGVVALLFGLYPPDWLSTSTPTPA
jgi:hypothetical protein